MNSHMTCTDKSSHLFCSEDMNSSVTCSKFIKCMQLNSFLLTPVHTYDNHEYLTVLHLISLNLFF